MVMILIDETNNKKDEQPYFGNCESSTDHGPDRGSRFADRRPLRRSGPVQNRSGPAGPRLSDWTAATLTKARDFKRRV
jgi:hypothetical protein